MRIAIAGSSGMIGTALSEALQLEGHEVRPLVRGAKDEAGVDWSPTEQWISPTALAGCDVVVNLAGASIGDGRWSTARKKLLVRSRIDSTRVLVRHMASDTNGPRRLVNASAIGYYGDRADDTLHEDAAQGDGFLADLVRDWEAEALAGVGVGLSVVCARLGVVLNEDGGALAKMLTPFKLGVGGRLGSGNQWFSWVSLEDAVRAFVFLATSGTEGKVNVVAPEPVRNKEMTSALGRALGRPTIFPIPRLPLRILIGESVDELLFVSQRVSSDRIREAGFEFRHPTIDAGFASAFGKDSEARISPGVPQ